MTHRYQAYGITIASNIELPELPVSKETPDCLVRVCIDGRSSSKPRPHWVHRSTRGLGGPTWIAIGRTPTGYVIRFPRLAEFAVRHDGLEIEGRPAPGLPGGTLRHLLIDHVLPRVLDLRGELVLHAACVAAPDGARLLLGRSGRGKSTLATSLARAGLRLLSDDIVVLREIAGTWHVLPSYPSLRLWPDSAAALLRPGDVVGRVAHDTEKTRSDATRLGVAFTAEPVPVVRAYVLEPRAADAHPRIDRLSSREAFGELAAQTFRFDPTDTEALAAEWRLLAHLATMPWFRRLAVPRAYEKLDLVAGCVRDDAAAA